MRGNGEYVAYIDYVLAGMQRAGAVVLEEEQFALRAFRDRAVLPSDKLVSFFMSEDNAQLLLNTVRPVNRWVHIIDERATVDGKAYQGRIEYCKRFDVRHAVLTYTNPVHVQQIVDVNVGFTVMPC